MGLELFAAATTGLAICLFAVYAVRARQPDLAGRRISSLKERPVSTGRGISWDQLRRRGPSSIPLFASLLSDSAWAKRTADEIEQTGMKLRVGEFLAARIAFAIVAFAIVAVAGQSTIAYLVGLVCGAFAFMLPAVWLTFLRHRRIERISKQMPEAITLLTNSLRAGFAFQHGMSMISDQMEPPISQEFARVMVDMNVGASVEEALQGLLKRADSEDVNMLVTAVLIQRSSGGNLAELLETVGETMRQRERLTGEVKTLTSQQRFSGMVLSLWPIVLLGVFSLLNWHSTKLLFTTNVGLVLLAIGGTLQLIGYYVIRRILDIEV